MTDVVVSQKKLLGTFTLALLAGWAGFVIIQMIADTVFHWESKNSAMSLVLIMCAAIPAGGSYYKQASEMPAKGFAWKMAAKFALIAIALAFLLLIVLAVFELLPELSEFLSQTGLMLFLGILSFLLFWPAAWSGFYLGARSARKQAMRSAAKA